ncbi:tetratricopeptide repeat protein [Bergeyella porcorum]|uniref:tetratricopeptide repeat protein n=1 Tax=Bergeyella porcorum TaxID=1735111 RepID=UPI0035E4ACAB
MVKRIHIAYIFILFGFFWSNAQERYAALIHKGNQQYEKGNFERSVSHFMDAATKNPKDFVAHYNLGNALYKQKKYEEAASEYEKAAQLASTKEHKVAALYNQGNVYMQTQNANKAAQLYKQALKQDPYNETIRKNYEIAKLKEKENQQQNQDDNKGGKGGDNQDQQKEQNNPKQGNGGQQKHNEGKGDEQEQNSPAPQQKGMPKDEQEALLNRIEGKEQETARKILNKNSYSMPRSNEKDW